MIEEQGKNMSELQERVEGAASSASMGGPTSPGSLPSPSPAGGPSGTPFVRTALQARTGRLGNVGWDSSPEELLTRARAVLSESGCDPQSVELHLAVGRNGKGSGVTAVFQSVDVLDMAALRIRSLRKNVVPGRTGTVWLRVQYVEEELVPVRVLRKLEATLRGYAETLSSKPEVTSRDMAVSANNDVVAWVQDAHVQWSADAATYFTAEQMRCAKGLAEARAR